MIRFSSNKLAEHEIYHNRLIREQAAECTLFLKRNGDFPVSPCTVNLYGSGARRTIKGGKGSGDVNTRYMISVEKGLENAGFTVETKTWLDCYDELYEQSVKGFWDALQKEAEELQTSPYYLIMDRTKPPVEYNMPLNGKGELNIYVIARDTSEGMDRKPIKGDYYLLDSEVRDIKELVHRKEKFLLVLNVGSVLDLSPVLSEVENILLLSQLGAETGNIFADIITGKSVPSGKLTDTWAKNINDYPSTSNFGGKTEINYEEGLYVGYRYFSSFGVETQFPFGFGLGYTDFSFVPNDFSVAGNAVKVSAKVKNTGNIRGKEVLQLYVSKVKDCKSPKIRLAAFAKTRMLEAGEEAVLTLTFDMTDMAVFDEEKRAWILEAGVYQLYIGKDAENMVCAASVIINADFVTGKVYRLSSAPIKELKRIQVTLQEKPILGEKVFFPQAKKTEQINAYHSLSIANMSDEELVRMCVGVLNDMTLENNIGNSGKQVAGAAGETYSDEKIKALVLADGPAGLRISPTYQLDENGRVKASQNALAGILPGGIQKIEGDGELFYQYCTAIPVGTALAQSYNISLMEGIGALVGKEMELFGVDIWLAPALNIHRNPLCGRNFEYYSEDPLVSGLAAAAITRGVQSNVGRSVTIKHFCCNNQETDRFFSSSNLTERTLREIYLKAFEICIKNSHPNAMMSSYNLVNGTHTANSKELFEVLREEFNWYGLVMTDWLATGGMGNGIKYASSTARGCIAAGNDLIMPGRDEDIKDILEALKKGELTRADLECCANRILRLSESKLS